MAAMIEANASRQLFWLFTFFLNYKNILGTFRVIRFSRFLKFIYIITEVSYFWKHVSILLTKNTINRLCFGFLGEVLEKLDRYNPSVFK